MSLDNAVAKGRTKLAAFMKDTAVISHPGKPTGSSYGDYAPGTPTTATSACSIFPALDGVLSESIVGQKLQGRAGWEVIFPFGTAIDRTCTLAVTTQAGGVYNLEVLEVRDKQTRVLSVKAICAQIVDAPAIP